MELNQPPEIPETPDGMEPGACDAPTAAALNDRAYGYDENGFRAALAAETSIRWLGAVTASLQATKAGAPIYERLGFRDFGFIEMWELRR